MFPPGIGQEARPGFTEATGSAWRVALEARSLGGPPSTSESRRRAYSNASATHFNGFEPAQVVHVNE
jgi:hypothetical protein